VDGLELIWRVASSFGLRSGPRQCGALLRDGFIARLKPCA